MTNAWRTLLAGLFVGAALTIEHLLWYDPQAMIEEPELTLFCSNLLGTATIAGGVAIAAERADETARHIIIAATGGAVVLALRIARRQQRQHHALQYGAGHAAGQIRGANGYEQAYQRAAARSGRA